MISLPNIGIEGNSRLSMQGENNEEIAETVIEIRGLIFLFIISCSLELDNVLLDACFAKVKH